MLPLIETSPGVFEPYVTTGACLPFADFIDDATYDLKVAMDALAGPFSLVLSDSCDITGAIDAMLDEGAAELKKNIAIVSKLAGEALAALSDLLGLHIIDEIFDAVEGIIAGILGTVKDVIEGAMALMTSITNMILNAVQGVKAIICDASLGFLDSVPSVLVQGTIAAVAIKGLKTPNQKELTNNILKSSGIDNAFGAAADLKSMIDVNIHGINNLKSMTCGGSLKAIDNFKIVKDISAKF